MKSILIAALLATASLAAAHAQQAPTAEASIPFVNHQGIHDWTAGEDDKTLYVQDAGHNWYRASLAARCLDLPFATKVGFETRSTGQFDRFSSVVVGDKRCDLTSLVRSAPPANRSKHH